MAVEVIDTGALKKAESRILGAIPNSWLKTTLGDCFRWGSGGTPKSGNTEYYGGGIPWLVIGDLNDGIITKSGQTISELGLKNSSAKLVDEGTLLLAMYGSIGKLGVAGMKLATNQAIAFAEKNEIETKYIFNFLRYVRPHLNELGKGATQQNISQTVIKAFPFPLAPLNEQKRIVAKIEELFSELDNGIAALKTAREQLKVYRQAVLKHAFEGELTVRWRKENSDKLESPEQLLARIHQERETRYQQQLKEWKAVVKEWEANDKEGKKPGKPKEFIKQGELGAGSELSFEIPDSWTPMLMGHVFSVHVGATPSRKKNDFWNGDVFWVSSGEVAFCEIHKTSEMITTMGYENTSTEIHPEGTVLLAMIGEGKTRGQAAILRVPAAHNQNTAAIRVSEVNLSPEYIYYYLQYQYEQTRRVGSGNNQKALNKHRVSSIQFPLCSIQEQIAVVDAISEKLSFVENLDVELDVQIAKSETLRHSILKKAFSGQLIPQDPSDEPATELLARIVAEKAAMKNAVKPKSAGKTRSKQNQTTKGAT